ncbi:MAG: transposase family protein [Acaryochloris sp. RU_4_1]|nr:transposase family protein [Acaryochloris sp. RU_4_1]NJR56176.1 transposase family protein [Acaryochloris sp. CRU_2_0]
MAQSELIWYTEWMESTDEITFQAKINRFLTGMDAAGQATDHLAQAELYVPASVTTDGWIAAQNAWITEVSDIDLMDCKLHVEQGSGICLKLRFIREGSECPGCGRLSDQLHQNRPIQIRDLSIFGKRTLLDLPRRQYYCSACQNHFSERLAVMDWRRRYTQRYEFYIYQRVQHSNIEQVGREEGLSCDQVQWIFQRQYSQKKTKTGVKLSVKEYATILSVEQRVV